MRFRNQGVPSRGVTKSELRKIIYSSLKTKNVDAATQASQHYPRLCFKPSPAAAPASIWLEVSKANFGQNSL